MRLRLDRGPDGTPVDAFVDFIYEPITEADGTISGVFVEGYEVTDRLRAEQALRHSEEQLRLATEAAEVGLWDVDGFTGDLYWPPRVKAMFGISPDAPATMDDFFAGLHPEDREKTTVQYEAAVDPTRRALYDVEYRTVGKEDGVLRWVAAKGRGVFDDEGRCVRVIGTAIEITQRKADEARLRGAQREPGASGRRGLGRTQASGRHHRRRRRSHGRGENLDYNCLAVNRAAADLV